MKRLFRSSLGTAFLILCGVSAAAQAEMSIDTVGYEYFTYQEGDTTSLMKKYFVCFLKAGPNRDQDAEEAQRIQIAHLAHLESLAKDGKICMVGPYDDGGEIRGMTIFSTKTQAEAEALAKADPAVKAGRLRVEIHPWWAAAGSKLF